MIEFNILQESCRKHKCLLFKKIGIDCDKSYKQKSCYNTYVKRQERKEKELKKNYEKRKLEFETFNKNKLLQNEEFFNSINACKDMEWEAVMELVRERDKSCLLTKILTADEKTYLNTYEKDNLWISKKFPADGAHVISRHEEPKLIYEVSNVFLLNRLFHSRLDSFQHPITGKSITAMEREHIFLRILIDNNVWEKGETFESFKNKMLKVDI